MIIIIVLENDGCVSVGYLWLDNDADAVQFAFDCNEILIWFSVCISNFWRAHYFCYWNIHERMHLGWFILNSARTKIHKSFISDFNKAFSNFYYSLFSGLPGEPGVEGNNCNPFIFFQNCFSNQRIIFFYYFSYVQFNRTTWTARLSGECKQCKQTTYGCQRTEATHAQNTTNHSPVPPSSQQLHKLSYNNIVNVHMFDIVIFKPIQSWPLINWITKARLNRIVVQTDVDHSDIITQT